MYTRHDEQRHHLCLPHRRAPLSELAYPESLSGGLTPGECDHRIRLRTTSTTGVTEQDRQKLQRSKDAAIPVELSAEHHGVHNNVGLVTRVGYEFNNVGFRRPAVRPVSARHLPGLVRAVLEVRFDVVLCTAKPRFQSGHKRVPADLHKT